MSRRKYDVTKGDLVDRIVELNPDLTKKKAKSIVDTIFDEVKGALGRGKNVKLNEFMFYVDERAARKGRNPQTGEEIQIPAKKVVKFNAGKSLEEEVK